jgi:hypothetical protein
MKFIISLILTCLSYSSYAAPLSWSELAEGSKYKLSKKIVFQIVDSEVSFPKDTQLKLIETSELSMIKVHLYKYEILNCSKRTIESDLELIQSSKNVSVGVNLAKKCILEVFVELKDYKTKSFLK